MFEFRMRLYLLIYFSVSFIIAICGNPLFGQNSSQISKWRVMPIRSQWEFNQQRIGGEGYQHLHGIARCRTKPDVIYLSQDCAQVWRSNDGGNSWKKVRGENLRVKEGESIEVDPINPNIVFVIAENHANAAVTMAEEFIGLYRSNNGGDSWQLVLKAPTIIHRRYQHSIAYDRASITATGAARWYAAFPNNGIYYSENSGNSWIKLCNLENHNPVYNIQTHPLDGQTLFVATNLGFFKITRSNPVLHSLGDLPAGAVSSIAINEQNPLKIYVTLKDQGLYRSIDGGSHFTLLKSFDAQHIFINPGSPVNLYLIGTSSNINISHDEGQTWNNQVRVLPTEGLNRYWKTRINGALAGVVPNPSNPDEIVAYAHATLWKSTNDGSTFNESSTLFTGYAWSWWNDGAAFDIQDPNRFCFFCCDVGMIITETGGDYFEKRSIPENWLSNGTINWSGMHAGDFQPIANSNVILASLGEYFNTKIAQLGTNGSDWTITSDKYENNLFIAFHPQNPNVVYAGKKRSFDAGATFETIQALADHDAEILGYCGSNPDVIYAMAKPRNTILRSDDKGDNWRIYTQVDWYLSRLDSKPTFAVDPVDPNKIYTINRQGDLAVYNGKNWQNLNVLSLAGGAEYGNFVRTVAIDPRQANIVYAGTYYAGLPFIFRSQDSGTTWQDITDDCPRMGSSALSVHPITGDLLQGTVCGTWIFPPPYNSPQSLYQKCIAYEPHSTPVELNFFSINIQGRDCILKWSTASESNNYGFEIQRRSEYQSDFTKLNFVKGVGTSSHYNEYLYIDDDIAPGSYYYRLKQIDFDGSYQIQGPIKISLEAPQSIELHQIYPNPFNNSATISYTLSQNSPVNITIFDLSGKEVTTLVQEFQQKGTYKISWNAQKQASGIYFCRLKVGDIYKTTRMILLK